MKYLYLPKKKTFISQTLIGSFGAIIDIFIFSIIINFLSFEISFLIGVSLAVLINYLLTIKYSFHSLKKNKTKKSEILFFYISYFFTAIIQYSIIKSMTSLNIDPIISKPFAILIAFIFSFFLKWLFVFGKESEM